uniref:Death-associated protein-like protein n=1 Tax=Maconellicoccus hirsutus TaxID=177089 RepID=A2I444_MACHI|nr:death-associated protein-like protein [Maconellicoccus hirsutus]
MSSKNECELKAGHPPAVKAGNMRITQHKNIHDTSHTPVNDESVLKVSTSPPKSNSVSGAPVHGHSDFPAEAVQRFHEKPLPTHEVRCASIKPNIQQPRK